MRSNYGRLLSSLKGLRYDLLLIPTWQKRACGHFGSIWFFILPKILCYKIGDGSKMSRPRGSRVEGFVNFCGKLRPCATLIWFRHSCVWLLSSDFFKRVANGSKTVSARDARLCTNCIGQGSVKNGSDPYHIKRVRL